MLVEIKVPLLAESVAEATLMNWRKQQGDKVSFGEALIDIETDKVTLEVVAPDNGVLVEILKKSGEEVESDEVIAKINTEAQESFTAAAVTATEPAAGPEPATPYSLEEEDGTGEQPEPEPYQPSLPMEDNQPEIKLSPSVRSLVTEHNLNVSDIPTTGDRLTKKDVLDFLGPPAQPAPEPAADSVTPVLAGEDSPVAPAPTADSAGVKPVDENEPVASALLAEPPPPDSVVEKAAPDPVASALLAEPPPPDSVVEKAASDPVASALLAEPPSPDSVVEKAAPDSAARPEKRVAMTRLRKRVAERLLSAQRENAILTTFNEVNMQPVMDLRKRYKDDFEKTHGVKLGLMSFFTKAVIESLKRFPLINASVDGDTIIYHDYFDIGIAVSSPRGLVVPIIRDANTLSFAEIETAIGEYGRKARDSKLTIEELTGGTFTITNGGVFGSLLSTPILNPPQSAILGMHKIQERPVAENGAVVIRPMMYSALSYDHRIIDGREAVSFLVVIKEFLEEPLRLLLQV